MITPGKRFSFLTVLRKRKVGVRYCWVVKCDCGKEKTVQPSQLEGAERPTKSCGCKQKELLRAARLTHGASLRTSDLFQTFICWQSMMWRCYNKARRDWKNYGGRGIKVCSKWRSFENFYDDMGKKPAGRSLGRINNDGNYEPSNCRWETATEQARNKRTNTLLPFKGKRRTLAECSELTGINSDTISKRIESGWPISDALTRPLRYRMGGVAYG